MPMGLENETFCTKLSTFRISQKLWLARRLFERDISTERIDARGHGEMHMTTAVIGSPATAIDVPGIAGRLSGNFCWACGPRATLVLCRFYGA